MQCQQTNKNSQETVVSKISRIVFRKNKRRFMRTQKIYINQKQFLKKNSVNHDTIVQCDISMNYKLDTKYREKNNEDRLWVAILLASSFSFDLLYINVL